MVTFPRPWARGFSPWGSWQRVHEEIKVTTQSWSYDRQSSWGGATARKGGIEENKRKSSVVMTQEGLAEGLWEKVDMSRCCLITP